MPVRDLRSVSPDAPLEADFCVVGSGPAGAAIALELAQTNARVLLVESGGLKRDAETDALNDVENVGWPRISDQWLVRNRMLGGTSNTWAGRCVTFDRIDYQRRDWVPHSGWAVGPDELQPYVARSALYLGLVADIAADDERFRRDVRTSDVDEKLFSPCVWQFSRIAGKPDQSVNSAGQLMASKAHNLDIILNATATHVSLNDAGSAVSSIDVRSADGTPHKISAPHVILAAGGIENARLLLASNRSQSCGVGNKHGLVGRFLMDHLKGVVGCFDPDVARSLGFWFGQYFIKDVLGNHRTLRGLRLSPNIQRAEGLLNCAAFVDEHEHIAADDPWLALKRLLRGKRPQVQDAVNVTSNLVFMGRGLGQRFVHKRALPRKLQKLELKCIVEQQPDPDSRVTLSDRVDRFGVPLSRIDWKVNEQEQRTIKATAKLLRSEFARLQLDLNLDDWVRDDQNLPEDFRDIAHPTGTTRMSADPGSGVVDPDCQVHGVCGLFIAGSSVFPTSGHANPTQMAVALAIRLADALKKRINSPSS